MAARRSSRARRTARRRPSAAPAVERITTRGDWPLDFYHRLLTTPWRRLFVVLAIAYIAFNLVFAGLYLLQPGAIANARPRSFTDAFFFSVQTMATIGYGEMRPVTLYANLLVTVEVLLGMTGLAVASGLVFARFSRPTARVMFSKVAVITNQDGVPSLMFRAANQRRNEILEAQVTVMLLRDEVSSEGVEMRRFHDMVVSRPHTPMFALTWTVIHPIDKESPLYGLSREDLAAAHAQIVASIVGIDETFSQTVYARHDYDAGDIHWNRRLADILSRAEDGRRSIDYRRFHDTVEASDSPRGAATPRKVKA
ncbi:MAG TPA: ion channel [Stellaceae bacterium]|jgi:inward rectifier potassium channel